ncbi:hypothetical protein NL676_020874 [Syzygium grande]|nr:hypothetical protein NL676_020874 [Syzygium grande]
MLLLVSRNSGSAPRFRKKNSRKGPDLENIEKDDGNGCKSPRSDLVFAHSRSSRSNLRRSLVAESSTRSTCFFFFFENDGSGSELGSGDTANADPA